MLRWGLLLSLWTALAVGGEPARFRRPVDAEWLNHGQTLITANSRSGTLSMLDLTAKRVVAEIDVGGQPVDLLSWGDTSRWAVVDCSGNRLVWCTADPHGSLKVVGELPVGRGPQTAAKLSATSLSVTSRWDHTVERIRVPLSAWPPFGIERQVLELPFAPHLQLLLPGDELLVVTDHAGDQLAVIALHDWTLHSVRRVQGHNIRGLILSSDQQSLLLAQQMLNQQVATSQDAVRDGILLQNVVRELPLNALRERRTLLPTVAKTVFLGRAAEGAADPSGLAMDGAGQLCVSLGGVDQLGIVSPGGRERVRPVVGSRPTTVLPRPGMTQAIVVNTLSDSLSLVDTQAGQLLEEFSLGPMPPLGPADRGERLFHDGRLSLENWMSCHSCHTDGHANEALTDTFGDHSRGTPKRVLTLLGGRDANPWGWTGDVRELHTQVMKSIDTTMQGPPLTARQINDLVAYLHTLEPAPPLQPITTSNADKVQWTAGQSLFREAGCAQCHIPPLTYSSDVAFDVGHLDEAGHRTFNPPFLKGVSQRFHFFHDGSAHSLHEVINSGHFTTMTLNAPQREALIRYLRSL
ncbi:MAG: hypothetical protein DWH91_15210 [Planctomycetota bacterium]|nr:MAG: hypothetical protein DWH91_15210 [Planctomycetota bacterium]